MSFIANYSCVSGNIYWETMHDLLPSDLGGFSTLKALLGNFMKFSRPRLVVSCDNRGYR